MHQVSLFGDGQDSPLFSGVAATVVVEPFVPTEAGEEQPGLFQPSCQACMDTGWIRVSKHKVKRCLCGATALKSATE